MHTANDIRRQFIDFFVQRHGHTFVPSSPVVPLDDPTLMFTNAGMNQFKDVFLGTGTRPYRRAVNSQKCIRASGKHNDLEDVGRDTYHHTFFEMLGNWSFGDYYKAEAIAWAWELLTKVWGIDKSRLHATVFGGDAEFGLEPDEEAATLWAKVTDINPKHIHRFGRKDNFWMMGETGPCGPCTEIHIDRTPDGSGGSLVNAGDARVMEIWNLVFIQYNRDEAGKLSTLPAKHVDTGMGFERIAAVLQNKTSNYDTDVFLPIMEAIGDLTGRRYGGRLDDLGDVGFRVLADHIRTLSFAITDGALPSNKGRGSVLRSILRRAVRFGWQCFGQREPFLFKLVPTVVSHMGGAFPELQTNPSRVADVIRGEEADFLRTIDHGLSLFEDAAGRATQQGRTVAGGDVFTLYTTFGFPPDLTRQMAQERGLTIDEAGFLAKMKEHEQVSRGKETVKVEALKVSGNLPATDDRAKWFGLVGEGKILGWIQENRFLEFGALTEGSEAALLLDRTCFYAEAGGQIGDTGSIETSSGTFTVTATQKLGSAVVHLGRVSAGKIEVGQKAWLQVDPARELTRKNHTATHLVHWALQHVLGSHVEQRGSFVGPQKFTFDFAHGSAMTAEQKADVERLVNERICQDLEVQWRELPIADAKKLPGVRAFFGDKYGDVVRVVEIGDGFSREFCGGTHLERTGQIGYFKLIGEETTGKGVRRITALTGPGAVRFVQDQEAVLGQLLERFRCQPSDLPDRVEKLQEEVKKLQHQLKKGGGTGDLAATVDRLLAEAPAVGGAVVIVGEVPTSADDAVRQQVDRLKQKAKSCVVLLGWSGEEGKVSLLAAVSDDLQGKVHAGKLVGEAAALVGGKGGGRPGLAQAGGKDASKLPEALAAAKASVTKQLGG